jgi:hypothetical protein
MDGILTAGSPQATAEAWLGDFGAALAAGDAACIARLFAADCHWRDILAFAWDLRTTSSAAAIADRMVLALAQATPRAVVVAVGRTPPRRVTRAGVETIEAIFTLKPRLGLATVSYAWCPRAGKPAPGR